jgi:asparagine N-glycosylation enzyme membrane subunit Stt3
MSIVNKPRVSRAISGFYAVTAAFVLAVFGVVFYFILTEEPPNSVLGIAVLVVVILFVEAIMISLLISLYRTRYVVTETELILKAPRLIGGTKRVPLDTIMLVERTLIPFGFRLFGASFYGGYYYFPGVGRSFMVITNFEDGVLVKAKNGAYIITPSNPCEFIEKIQSQNESAQSDFIPS